MTAALLLLLGLTGCGTSAPVRYHALAGRAVPLDETQASAALLVEVLPVAIPERINREEIVLTGKDGRLDIRDGERWAAPLADEFRQAVDDELWRLLRAADTYAAPVAPGGGLPQYRLALRVERFDAIPERAAMVEGSWTIRRRPEGQAAVCRAGFVVPVAAGIGTATAALAEGTRRLAEAVAASLSRLHAGKADPCAVGEGG